MSPCGGSPAALSGRVCGSTPLGGRLAQLVPTRHPRPRRARRAAAATGRPARGRRRHSADPPRGGDRPAPDGRQPPHARLCPGRPAAAGAPGRGPARLHPDRGRLRSRHRLVGARRPARLRAALPRAEARQPPLLLLRLVRAARPGARPWRGAVDPADDRPHAGQAPSRSRAGLHHRPVGGRRHDLGHARHLSRAVRGRRHPGGPALRQRLGRPRGAGQHVGTPEPQRPRVGRPGAGGLGAPGPLAADLHLAR